MTQSFEKSSMYTHSHRFDPGSLKARKGTNLVFWITLFVMVLEIFAGIWFHSMALLADGWHMSSHALAVGLSLFAYKMARRYENDLRFSFGTWKIEVLGGFTSAIFLVCVAFLMIFESSHRFFNPGVIQYKEAIFVAILGLIVNIVCALILGDAHHDHSHDHLSDHVNHKKSSFCDHTDSCGHEDLNLKAAYIHVLADAATSILAIIALVFGLFFGLAWLDPLMGILGAILMLIWAKDLIIKTARILLDCEMDHPVVEEIRELFAGDDQITILDLHVWKVGNGLFSCAISLFCKNRDFDVLKIRQRLCVHEEIVHSTIELHFEN